jgi:hypothetical protein
MKINLIPTKKLALLSAAVCAAMLAFSHNASGVTVLGYNDVHTLGSVNESPNGILVPDADRAALVNHLIGQALNTNDLVNIFPHFYSVRRFGNNFGPLPGPAVFALNGTGTNITIGSGLYSYLWASYSYPSGLTEARVWYIGNLSGDITIPVTVVGVGTLTLVGWTLFGPGVPGVPDGGTTVMLLGAALGALGMARRFLKA